MTPETIRNQIDREVYESAIAKKEDVQIRLPWRISCKIAVLAYLNSISFDDVISRAVENDLRGNYVNDANLTRA